MGLFSRLFGAKKSDEELEADAQAALQSADGAASPKEARRILLRAFDHGPVEALVDFGGKHHNVFLTAVLRLSAEDGATTTDRSSLPTLRHFDDPDQETWREILDSAAEPHFDLVLVRETQAFGGHRLILCAIEVWAMFAVNPDLGACFLGEGYLMMRRGLLAHLVEKAPEIRNDKLSTDLLAGLLEDVPEFGEADHERTPFGYEVYCYRASRG